MSEAASNCWATRELDLHLPLRCFLAVGKHALYLVRRSRGGLYPNDQSAWPAETGKGDQSWYSKLGWRIFSMMFDWRVKPMKPC